MPEREMTMIERVARAIYDVTSVDDVTLPWDRAKAGQRELHMEWARAAIDEMRDPSKKMCEAAAEAYGDGYGGVGAGDAEYLFKAMVDAALKEQGEKP